MRLIDADSLINKINKDTVLGKTVRKMIEIEPTAYDVGKVVEQFEELNKFEQSKAAEYDEVGRIDMIGICDAKVEAYRNSRRIVKSGGIE